MINADNRIAKEITDVELARVNNIYNIRPKKYKYVDKVQFGDKERYGLIGQDVETHFPEVVTTTRDFIPNVYIVSDSINKNIIVFKDEHHLKVADKIKIFTKEKKDIVTTLVIAIINPTTIQVAHIFDNTSSVFVFGKEVDDYKMLDYNQLIPVIVRALQDQHDIILDLQNQINNLKSS